MGEMADLALDQMMDQDEIEVNALFTPSWQLSDFERECLYDEHDSYIGGVFTRGKRYGPRGPGPCPQCHGPTQPKNGRHGLFYGCCSFPRCHGSRSR